MNRLIAALAITATLFGGSSAVANAAPKGHESTTVSASHCIGKIVNNIKKLFKQSPAVGHSGRNN